jgi:transcriptional regulator with XRE-family HTH domain
VQRLAAQLRQLREDAGRPSYRQLAKKAYYSHSALSQAAAGKELPSLAVTLAFAQACGGDRSDWTARWRAAAATVGADADPPGGVRRDIRLRPGWGAFCRIRGIQPARWHPLSAAAVAAVVVAGLFWLAGVGHAPAGGHAAAGGLAAPVFDGAYPTVADCDATSRMLGSSSVRTSDGAILGMVELRYSLRCGAVWARFDPSPQLSRERVALITVGVIRRPDGTTVMSSARYNGRRQRSDMLLLHSGCAQGSVKITEQGRVTASAVTPCQRPL